MKPLSFLHSVLNRRVMALLILGIASGLPLALIGSTLQAWFTESGIAIVSIGMLSLVGQPYVYKFLWSPLMDRVIPPLLGRRRGWILICQIALILAILGMTSFEPKVSPLALAIVAFGVAFCSASQDISISAYLVDICPEEKQRGIAAAAYITGYRVAIIISGAGALILAQHIGFKETYFYMSWVMLACTVLSLLVPEPDQTKRPSSLKKALIEPVKEFVKRRGFKAALLMLILLILYKLGDAFLLSFNTTFLLRGLHFSLTDVALANKLFGMTASFAGGILGGILMTRIPLYRALIGFGILQALSNLAYVLLAYSGHSLPMLMTAVFTENFCSGLGSCAFVALTMSLCLPKYSAAQYSLLNALESSGRVYIGPFAGLLLLHVSWTTFYWVSFALAFPGIIVLLLIGRERLQNQFAT